MRGNARRYPDKRESAANAEAWLCTYLTMVRPHMRAGITVDTILSTHAVTPKTAQYRLMLAQQRWAAEAAQDPNDPPKCSDCGGRGSVTRFRMDDRAYPVKCSGCDGSGVARK